MPRSKARTRSSPRASGWVSCVVVLNVVGGLFIWEPAAASSASRKGPVIATLPPLSNVRGGITESNRKAGPSAAVLIDADDIIEESTLASRRQPERDASEQVFKSTHVYRTSPSPTAMRRKRKRRWDRGFGEKDQQRSRSREREEEGERRRKESGTGVRSKRIYLELEKKEIGKWYAMFGVPDERADWLVTEIQIVQRDVKGT